MTIHNLHLTLLSETTFGRGDGVAGLVDQEVTHEPTTGLPFLRGRTLKGLLVEECANILSAVKAMQSPQLSTLHDEAKFLFGEPGSQLQDDAKMRVGTAQLPAELRTEVKTAILNDAKKRNPIWTKEDVLNALTAIRRQTAVDNATGIPETGSLRAMRVLLRNTELTAQLEFAQTPSQNALALLAACAAGLHRAGTGRNRGRGRVRVVLDDAKTMNDHLDHFAHLIGGDNQ